MLISPQVSRAELEAWIDKVGLAPEDVIIVDVKGDLPYAPVALGRLVGFVYLMLSGKTSGAGPEKLAMLIGHTIGVIVMYMISIQGLRYGIRQFRSTPDK